MEVDIAHQNRAMMQWPTTRETGDQGTDRLNIPDGEKFPAETRCEPAWVSESESMDLCNEVIMSEDTDQERWKTQGQGWLDRRAIWNRACRVGAVGSMAYGTSYTGTVIPETSEQGEPLQVNLFASPSKRKEAEPQHENLFSLSERKERVKELESWLAKEEVNLMKLKEEFQKKDQSWSELKRKETTARLKTDMCRSMRKQELYNRMLTDLQALREGCETLESVQLSATERPIRRRRKDTIENKKPWEEPFQTENPADMDCS